MAETAHGSDHGEHDGTRRDFLMMAAGGMGAVAAGAAVWPLIDSLNPAADALAVAHAVHAVAQPEHERVRVVRLQRVIVKYR